MSQTSTEFVILRHGEAENSYPDVARKLTLRGKKQIASQCQWLLNEGFFPQLILHSPYQRTTETALICKQYFPDAHMKIEQCITPDGDPDLAGEFMITLDESRILLCSHMPFVARLTHWFIPESTIMGFPVAGLCHIESHNESKSTTSNRLLNKHWVENESL